MVGTRQPEGADPAAQPVAPEQKLEIPFHGPGTADTSTLPSNDCLQGGQPDSSPQEGVTHGSP